ncbi:retropepsin-like aspartic protease family protein [Sphingopyxis panaciterrulae]|uniref:Aspartyl protease family protein n=1 Tax=Sphingopyxis panaciterrulae TaxID=462372 RepID=A0A7W9ETJ5_9SPHN|nr:retropepsin-like aspartic protease [Sphingopyxis panaciterrulae]MBB5708270.1 aspartyl protease family protein [Sphingopyxis panaciterrulae]
MLGRILGMAAVIAVASIGMASIASRTRDARETEVVAAAADANSNWTTRPRQKGGWSSAPSATGASGDVRLDRAGDSHFYAEAEINGQPMRMLVDSGASIIALTRRDAEAAGIDVDALPVAGSAATAGGVVPVRPVMLDSVDVGGIAVRGVAAAVLDADMGVSLLGQSYLARLDTVNVEGDTMTLR